jgi:hypothetical protein
MVLLSSRDKDSRLLLISGGLGIQFAGSAIGDAVQELANQAHHSQRFSNYALMLSRSGAVFSTLTGFACLYIWWHAFRPAREATRPSKALLEGATQRKS